MVHQHDRDISSSTLIKYEKLTERGVSKWYSMCNKNYRGMSLHCLQNSIFYSLLDNLFKSKQYIVKYWKWEFCKVAFEYMQSISTLRDPRLEYNQRAFSLSSPNNLATTRLDLGPNLWFSCSGCPIWMRWKFSGLIRIWAISHKFFKTFDVYWKIHVFLRCFPVRTTRQVFCAFVHETILL